MVPRLRWTGSSTTGVFRSLRGCPRKLERIVGAQACPFDRTSASSVESLRVPGLPRSCAQSGRRDSAGQQGMARKIVAQPILQTA
jgi:hypothetical protein